MVAAAKLRRAQERMIAARPYAAASARGARLGRHARRRHQASAAGRARAGAEGPAARRHRRPRSGGAFNTNVLRAAQNAIAEKGWTEVHLVPIGRKAIDFFKRRTLPDPPPAAARLPGALARDRARDRRGRSSTTSSSGEVDAVYVVYNEFKSIIAQHVTLERLLPLERDAGTTQKSPPSTTSTSPARRRSSAISCRSTSSFSSIACSSSPRPPSRARA